jgi:hypothetical protein
MASLKSYYQTLSIYKNLQAALSQLVLYFSRQVTTHN